MNKHISKVLEMKCMKIFVLLIAIFIAVGCSSTKQNGTSMDTQPFVIYKTKADYSKNVPVLMNAKKTVIVSYPDPVDLKKGEGYRYPTQLSKGYLVDNKGINLNVAFTSFTYEEYAKRDKAPSTDVLLNKIIDKDPLLELYNCKEKVEIKGDLDKMNSLIKRNFKGCLKLK